MKIFTAPFAALLLATGLLSATGCQLIVGVDRSQIPEPGATGGGGQGGGSSGGCTDPSMCPGTDTDCQTRTCTNGQCGFNNAPAGPAATQTPSDCKEAVCDGKGMLINNNDDADILDDNNPCTDDICNAGTPENNPSMSGMMCSVGAGKLCDGNGACVECLGPTDCPSQVCQMNKCIGPTCMDVVKNANETDVDCGGPDCNPCADGLVCAVAGDCQSGVCTGNVCLAPTCMDTVENGSETDVDCGGPTCSKCGPGLGCSMDSDCVGGACSGSVCLPTCTDQVKNANETDVDCGGPTCTPCADGLTCAVGPDCVSKVCTGGVCQAPTCMDTQQNGMETDVDCGGLCPPCGPGQICTGPADCQSGVCTGGICQTATCMDGVKNGTETDIDCGGGTCNACMPGQICMVGSDCSSMVCTGGICTMPSCGDGVVLGAEQCDDGNIVGTDGCDATCMTEFGYSCMGTPSVCTSSCGDGLRAGNEPCDDGNTASNDGCAATCVVELGYSCLGNQPSVCAPVCGDGLKIGVEQCDDSNQMSGDCCSSTCQLEAANCEIEPNGNATLALANGPFAIGALAKGFIKPVADQDYYAFTLPSYSDVKVETFDINGPNICASIDTEVELRGINGTTVLTSDDDAGPGFCSLIDPALAIHAGARHLAPGTYYVSVHHYNDTVQNFFYTLRVTLPAVCGNNMTQGSEQCDGGPLCGPDCLLLPVCGDTILSAGEQCDDGNTNPGDGCGATCQYELTAEVEPNNTCATASGPVVLPTMVNAFALVSGSINPAAESDWFTFSLPMTADLKFETFDSTGPGSCAPSTVDTEIQVFAANCTTPVSPIQDQGGLGNCSKLDPLTATSVRQLPAGDYKVRVFPFNVQTFNYTLHVQVKSSCGNNIKDGFEGCDDGNQGSGDGCSSTCLVEPGYVCNGSPSVCMLSCGNSIIDGADQCDDGNMANFDGCSSICKIEAGYTCVGAPSVCSFTCGNGTLSGNEQCDDANMANNDGCSPTCQVEQFFQCTTAPLPSMCTKQETNCSDGMDNDGDSFTDAADSDCTLPAYFPACAAGESLIVYRSVNVPKAIPDNNLTGITSPVAATLGGVTHKAAVLFDITHTYDGDLDMYLTPPGASALDICSGNGGTGENFTSTVLDSTCASPVTGGAAPYSNCYSPEASFTPLNGGTQSGTWTLKVADHANVDTGTLSSWSLVLCTTP